MIFATNIAVEARRHPGCHYHCASYTVFTLFGCRGAARM